MAWNLATAIADFAGDVATHGLRGAIVDQEQYQRRMSVCDACDQRNENRCRNCGCYLSIKAKARAWQCPLGKWDST